MKYNRITITIILLAVASYFVVRAKVVSDMDRDADYIFTKLVSADHNIIKKHLKLVNQGLDNAYAIMEKHKIAITNFNYKDSKPNLNLLLNKANIEISWHLTIFFHKKNGTWYISKFDELEEK